jgi:hypothetical protein
MYVYFAIGAALLLIGRKKENRKSFKEIPKRVEVKLVTPSTPQVKPAHPNPPVTKIPPVPIEPQPPSPTTDFDPLAIDPNPQPQKGKRKKK